MAPRKKSNRTTASKVPTSRKHAVQKSTPRKKPSGAKNTAASTRATRSTRTPAVLATTRTTRYQAVNAARNAVLNTTELLEHILIHLPADSILAAQRVSKTFKNVIQGSILIDQQIDFARDSPRNRPGKVESWQPDSATHPNSTTFEPWDNSSFTTAARLTVRDLNTCVFKSSPDPERRTNHYNFLSRTVPNGETFYFKSKNMSPAILRSMRLQPQSWDDFWITARHPTWRQPLVINMAIRIGINEPGMRVYGLPDGVKLRDKVKELEGKYGKSARVTELSIKMPGTIFPSQEERDLVARLVEERERLAAEAAEEEDDV
ncbi:hypothetical protein CLAFUR4_07544 [Fulvia fulva]|nr:hypothetical protein CLAFUR4_07544 [Fulvia fulva]